MITLNRIKATDPAVGGVQAACNYSPPPSAPPLSGERGLGADGLDVASPASPTASRPHGVRGVSSFLPSALRHRSGQALLRASLALALLMPGMAPAQIPTDGTVNSFQED